MTNSKIADNLKLMANLLELLEENPFKIKSLLNASFKVDKLDVDLSTLSIKEIEQLEGIGKSIAAKINEFNTTGSAQELNELFLKVPTGVVQMMDIKGIGPKKVATLWKQLGIESPGELLYACNENRLLELKGFGEKTQLAVKKAIEFTLSNEGKYLYSEIHQEAEELIQFLQKSYPNKRFALSGQLRRKLEIIDQIDIVGEASEIDLSAVQNNLKIKINYWPATTENFESVLFKTSASKEFIAAFENRFFKVDDVSLSENELFAKAGIAYLSPSIRETAAQIEKAAQHQLPKLIELNDIKGIFHMHTKYSDGASNIEDMAKAVREKGMQYVGITDHSKSAFYASGLSPERVLEQFAHIDKINANLDNNFRIFKGIESDILYDGKLDYEEDILTQFDFIIASVHSILKMDIEKATSRLLTAIENKYTTMLGHMTGRLLLSREGYPLHTKIIIDACAANGVVIELNANPYRLDIDWRWIDYCIEKGVLISINPDAHSINGLNDIEYGIYAAQKGMLNAANCFNTKSLAEVESYFKSKK